MNVVLMLTEPQQVGPLPQLQRTITHPDVDTLYDTVITDASRCIINVEEQVETKNKRPWRL